MGAKANPNRRSDIAAALKRAKPADMLSLEDLAFVWGSTKGPFVTAKKQMPGFPPPVLQGTQHIYAAQKALKAMLAFETRNDAAAESIAQRQNAILGGMTRRRHGAATAATIPARELQILNRLATEIEERERIQREYIPAGEVALIAGEVFSELSEFMAGLSNKVDPNGLLDPNLRSVIDNNASDALLRFHKRMKTILDADVDDGAARKKDGGARRAPSRRKRT